MLVKIFAASTHGVDASIINVEVNRSPTGLPKFSLVGLPDRAVNEANHRIESALKNLDYEYPFGRITVNLAPADLPKEGSAFDLPIAIGLMGASSQIKQEKLQHCMMVGELALDGNLRPVKGILPMAVKAKKDGFKYMVVPKDNGCEAAVVKGLEVYAMPSIREVVNWLNDLGKCEPLQFDVDALFHQNKLEQTIDFSDVKGQENVKRALEIAASGGHNLILVGPPGSGKTMMARRIPTILPPLTLDEALESTKVHSVAGLLKAKQALLTQRPFRSPHHTVSDVALVGGGSIPMPGEISLAHNGVLFLDELPEFKRSALEVMRQPLEDGFVSISRARMSVTYPSSIMLVASMNPSPSGDWFDPSTSNAGSMQQMQRYLGKISGPLLDRIDLHVEVAKVSFEDLSSKKNGEASADVRKRVMACREIQKRRFWGVKGVYCNAQMNTKMVRKLCALDPTGAQILKRAIEKLNLSARAYDRILKVSRTIADLEMSEAVLANHISEAIQYRTLDRDGWLG